MESKVKETSLNDNITHNISHYMIRIALCFFKSFDQSNPCYCASASHQSATLQTLSVALQVFSTTVYSALYGRCVVSEVGTNRFYTHSSVRGLDFPKGAV